MYKCMVYAEARLGHETLKSRCLGEGHPWAEAGGAEGQTLLSPVAPLTPCGFCST